MALNENLKYLDSKIQHLEEELAKCKGQREAWTKSRKRQQEEDTLSTDLTSKKRQYDFSHLYQYALSPEAIRRYSRQCLVPEFGVLGQQKCLDARVLIVGGGGLGCPIALYLAGAGIGTLGIIDADTIEESNLHRQITHRTSDVGKSKAKSIKRAVLELNPSISCHIFQESFNSKNAIEIVNQFDLLVDASDNPSTRYLVNDTCVARGRPFVSGSALGLEGHISVYNYQGGPCYRCCYPSSKQYIQSGNCSNNGVIGPVPGIIGTLQALEVLKVVSGMGKPLSGVRGVFDAWDSSFRVFKLGAKKDDCHCKSNGTIPHPFIEPHCSFKDDRIPLENEMTVQEMAATIASNEPYIVLDVREKEQFDLVSFRGSMNVPLRNISDCIADLRVCLQSKIVLVLCRRGVDSKTAVRLLIAEGLSNVYNIQGGLQEWSRSVCHSLIMY